LILSKSAPLIEKRWCCFICSCSSEI